MKTLYILRHAKAEPGNSLVKDKQRPLAERGRRACVLMAEYMQRQDYRPDCLLCSDAVRTRETAERIMSIMGTIPQVHYTDALYLASAEQIIASVQSAPETVHAVLLVGHNPGMHHAAMVLSRPENSEFRQALEWKYPTAALSVMRFMVPSWRQVRTHEGKLIDFCTPNQIAELQPTRD